MTTTKDFTRDWVTHVTDSWQQHLGHLKGIKCHALEIGSFEGRSACWFFDNILTHPESTLTCVDPWVSAEHERRFDGNTLEYSTKLRKIKGYSGVVMRGMPLGSFDYIYIDGNHEGKHVLEDAVNAWRLLRSGGVLIFDDYALVEAPRKVQPGVAIDAFLSIYCLTPVHKDWQVILRK